MTMDPTFSQDAWISVAELMNQPDGYCYNVFTYGFMTVSLQLGCTVDLEGNFVLEAIPNVDCEIRGRAYIEMTTELWEKNSTEAVKKCQDNVTVGSRRLIGKLAALDLWEAADFDVPPAADDAPWDPSHGAWLHLSLRVFHSGGPSSLQEINASHQRLPHEMEAALAQLRSRIGGIVQLATDEAPPPVGYFTVRAETSSMTTAGADATTAPPLLWVCRDMADRFGLVGLVAEADAIQHASSTDMGGVPSSVTFLGSMQQLKQILLACAICGHKCRGSSMSARIDIVHANVMRRALGDACFFRGFMGQLSELPKLVDMVLMVTVPKSPVRRALRTAMSSSASLPVKIILWSAFHENGNDKERDTAASKLLSSVDTVLDHLAHSGK